ncbi:MAG: cytidine deaminase [Blastocatellia bacterium]|nr:cytidine deaminase [Blastocatellia bacterium]MCS7157359.1 cytidine deaminase [Blastocatellia bacterium]MCX7753225.1 cytidine deaminase [Blastocatellia bacterium]MDW8168264.1 cytidine deaminase [Acidobacteriota bacterium]MDW8255443.1 cytidine deaminase [Acidobacteriota bacterium]
MTDTELIAQAMAARALAYAPYSEFAVGAALLTADDRVFTGCNIENASYGLTVCAERVALFKAVSEGVREFSRIALVADTEALISPCGACRQVLWEFAPDLIVVSANLKGQMRVHPLRGLLPEPFDGRML